MTLSDIKRNFFIKGKIPEYNITYWCTLLVKACPWLVIMARPEVSAVYNNCDPMVLDQLQIQTYLLYKREYDVIEISKIIECIKEDIGNNIGKEYKNGKWQ